MKIRRMRSGLMKSGTPSLSWSKLYSASREVVSEKNSKELSRRRAGLTTTVAAATKAA